MRICFTLVVTITLLSCNKKGTEPAPPSPLAIAVRSATIDGRTFDNTVFGSTLVPVMKIIMDGPVSPPSLTAAVTLSTAAGTQIPVTTTLEQNDSTVVIRPAASLTGLTKYNLTIAKTLQSASGGSLSSAFTRAFISQIDSSDKFSQVSDSALLDLVERQTFRYFWDFGHPNSGLARDRNTSGDVCTTGGTGFGVMAMLAAVQRNFVTRAEALARIRKIVSFLSLQCTRYHGAFPHWVNGATGETVPFSSLDDGADIVETALLMQGLLCARQYFDHLDSTETSLRNDINAIWNGVEWNWFRQGGQDVLYWHWSPNNGWAINMPVSGWNEALIVYVLAASSPTDSIPAQVYTNGWAKGGAIRNLNSYYGIRLPLGPPMGGPLFFAHYSFLGINPHGLSDAFANYWEQDTAHARINQLYCIDNPKKFYGYSGSCWGLTASDEDIKGYDAHSPSNDDGVLSPTAAIASLPFTPAASMDALRFFYYKLGDKIWGSYGFVDAFDLSNLWFATSFLAIDQGPEIVMIENYRSGLLWNLFMSCPEVQRGMTRIGFTSPYL